MSRTLTFAKNRLSPRRLFPLLVLTLLGAAVAASWRQERQPPRRPAVLSDRGPRASEQRCAECHSDITDDFHLAAHARTLHRASDEEVLARFAGRSFHREEPEIEYRYIRRDGGLEISTPAYARKVPITWIFGSGTHAQTPLITWTDREGKTAAIEHSVSWYPGDQLGITLGTEGLEAASGVYALGRHWGPAETANCFGCHCTFVPTREGRILFEEIQPGIGCARCHWDTEKHVAEMDRGDSTTIERFSEMTPAESVDRCGECHRRAGEMGGPITPEEPTIVRFAPVGLVQSPCFLRQNEVTLDDGQPARLDCTTCHDPHRPAVRDWRFHARACLNCHDAAHDRAADCPVAARQDNCISCHMPKRASNEHLEFTDHWIRVRNDVPPSAAE